MSESEEVSAGGSGIDRRSFIRSTGGYATAIAVTIGVPAAASKASAAEREHPPVAVDAPTDAAPSEPVMAYVHDATRGEVTIMSGTNEMTFRDPGLVKRLLAAANTKQG